MRKFLLSAFVLFSFIAYAIHKPYTIASGNVATGTSTQPDPNNALVLNPTATAPSDTTVATQPVAPTATPPAVVSSDTPQPANTPTNVPTNTLGPGAYKDGTYTGPQVDAFYGLVQVQVVIQNGHIANVTFLTYPTDRRTSAQINSIAVPYLQQEAIQAQTANVNIISGATLTSQAFAMSLQTALNQAH